MLHFYLLVITVLPKYISTKYLEGELNTSDNWAFLARFCFLSGDGQFEYYIEYAEEQGQPNLLLYYDTVDQWPSVYKAAKSCKEKESVLKIEQNQIVNLTIISDVYRELSGCAVLPRQSKSQKSTVATTKSARTRKATTLTVIPTKSLSNIHFITSTTEIPTTISEFSTTVAFSDFDDVANSTNFTETPPSSEEYYSTSEYFEITEKVTKAPRHKRAVPTKVAKRKNEEIGSRTIACHNARKFRSSRERWWFVAVSNCNGTKGIHIKYKILMTNGLPGDYWHEHFSADEFYVLPVLTAFSVAYSFLILGIVVCSIELKSRHLLHSTYKLFVVSVFVQFLGIILSSMSYLKYAVNGVGAPGIKMLGSMCMSCSETCFLLTLLLLAKGYTITRGRLSLTASVKLTIFMCLYSITFIALFIYEAKVFDPGEVLYLYESPAGYGVISLRIFAWFMFIYSTVLTLKKYPEKSNFYYPFNIFGTLWFIAGPAFILSANTYIDKWIRESVVCAVLLFITFGGHLTFLLLTMPSVANKNFPYHVRTTQIGIMELTGASGSSSIEHFGHHIYEPTRNVEQTVIIPLTKRTEELFGGIYSQRLYNSSFPNGNGEDSIRPLQTDLDIAMENVLTWSLAKNISALEFERSEQHLEEADELNSPDFCGRRESMQSEPKQNYDEWIGDVPIELFTVSKSVVDKQQGNE